MCIFEAPKSTENALKWLQNDAETRYVGRSTKASEYNGMRQKASGSRARYGTGRVDGSGQARFVKLPLVLTAGHSCLRNIRLCSFGVGLTGTPVAPTLGELARSA